ncbi:MAG: hypothetical protein MCM46_06840 [Candidatus Manganitrophus sp. SB1]|nr:hypothetical protein [Candidatus Manganitrophus morganii]
MGFLDFIQSTLQAGVNQTGLSPLAAKGVGVVLLLLFLLFAVRFPGKFLKFLVVVSIFFALSYVAFDVIQLGSERSQQIEKNQPSLTPE